ncbi:DUF2147 domain-containing protein [Ilyobacter polytropus]|uniref:DUF2147 domain-containing protein n=1 Tax=Ilyobacter polytropus (strain ATCC 51220 / DSM 2926 / LMG 16218 / CuHBu1) TaxID=572544 RepID=E3H6G9_ILYPC|nr:DUF2147 domain-containing protein [Ilyobacter polytropus]ADO82382.1 Protein of unknown function DUF2147 [Ilyobacter polytropus DSM 2926]
MKFFFIFIVLSINIMGKSFEGYWLIPSGKTIIHITQENKEFSGHVVWLKNPLYPKRDPMESEIQIDRRNPDPLLRNRKVMGLKVVGNMKLDSKNSNILKDGWVYDSWNGKKYYGKAVLSEPDILKLKGSLDPWGIFGYSQKCTRIVSPEKYGLPLLK